MKRDDDIRKELEDITRRFPEPLRHTVPEGYFEGTPDRILSRWSKEQSASATRIRTIRRLAAAAAMVGGIVLGILWWSQPAVDHATTLAISSEEAYQYILEHIDEFESLMLEDPSLMKEAPIEWPEADAIEEYLLEELQAEDIESLF